MTRAIPRLSVWLLALPLVLLSLSDFNFGRNQDRSSSKAGTNVRFTTGNSARNIPFDFEENQIYLKIRVNNSAPLKFGLDTGASGSLLRAAKAAALGLKTAGEVNVTGLGGTAKAGWVTGISLQLPGVDLTNQNLVAFPFDSFPCDVQDLDGFIGNDFIKEFVVEIDYEAKTISLFEPASYQYTGHGDPFPLTMKGTPRVHARVALPGQAPIDGLFEIDTGSDGALSINSPFVNQHALIQSLKLKSDSTHIGAGGESTGVDARIGKFELGRFVLANPLVTLSRDTEGSLALEDNDGPIGNEIFRRFKVTIDYSRRRMFLEPNAHLSDLFESDMSGIEFDSGGKDCRVYKVTKVAEKSPGAEAGVKTGDEILAVDGKPAKDLTSLQIGKLFMQNGARRSLTLVRANKTIVVKVKLRRLI